jgi:hypothetical protein
MRPRFVVLVACMAACSQTPAQSGIHWTNYHGPGGRLGWNASEAQLTPARLQSAKFGQRWEAPIFDPVDVGGVSHRAFAYATPLYTSSLKVSTGPYLGIESAVVFVATTSADVYAYAASTNGLAPKGAVLWKTRVSRAHPVPKLDGGVPLGILSTPVLDLKRSPPRLYVTSMDATLGWQAFALDATSGVLLPGWPVSLDEVALGKVNKNGPAKVQPAEEVSQRGALVLSSDGNHLYVASGSFVFASVGWISSIDTDTARVDSSFSVAPTDKAESNGGIWGAGGPSVDESGDVYLVTGNSPKGSGPALRTWGNSLLRLSADLKLLGSYTPFNYCNLDDNNIDLAGSATLILPRAKGADQALPLVAFGGKQGNVYLADASSLVTSDRRPPCSSNAAADRSLHPPGTQPQFGTEGPLNVFGPYSDLVGQLDNARMRTRPAYFRGKSAEYIFVSGSSKASEAASEGVPPGVVRLQVVRSEGARPYLKVDAAATELALTNPGSPLISSHGTDDAVVWVLDQTAPRSARFTDKGVRGPVLYAVDATTLSVLYRSNELPLGGKYATPVVADGQVWLATDRLLNFGVTQ